MSEPIRPTWLDDWLAALRSGNYEQGAEFLIQRNAGDGKCRFCCLGVLCDILGPRDWNPEIDWSMGSHKYSEGNGLIDAEFRDGVLEMSLPFQEELTDKNDSGWTFLEIADFIDKNRNNMMNSKGFVEVPSHLDEPSDYEEPNWED